MSRLIEITWDNGVKELYTMHFAIVLAENPILGKRIIHAEWL